MRRSILASLCVLFVAGTASGNTPYKWLQRPDYSINGIDVNCTNVKLADDFRCDATGPITEVHIWGSWKDDHPPYETTGYAGDPGAVAFNLKIYSDIADPDGEGELYSMPNDVDVLWEHYFAPGDFIWAQDELAPEGWYDPKTGQYLYPNHDWVWQYDFIAPPGDLFCQEEGTVYWLGIEAFPEDPSTFFGWKTSQDHNIDDAVYYQPLGSWHELRYPEGHSMHPDSIDLAFEIIPEPATICLLGLGTLALLRKRRV